MAKNDSGEITYNSYKSLFAINFKIHTIMDKKLARPIPLEGLIIFLVVYFPLFPIGHILARNHPWLATLFVSIMVTWALLQADPQGKFAPRFLFDIVKFFFRHKVINLAGVKVHIKKKHTINWEVMELMLDVISHNSIQK